MNVIECFLYSSFPEDRVSENLVDYVEQQYINKNTFKIKQVQEGMDPAKVLDGIIGYYSGYILPYISEPSNSNSLIYLDVPNKRLVRDLHGFNFEEQRDSFVYNSNPTNTYIRQSFRDVLQDFFNQGYLLFISEENNDLLRKTYEEFSKLSFRRVNSLDDFLE